MLPNSMKVLRGLGIEQKLRGFAFAPRSHLNREWDSGEVRAELPMPEGRYDAPYLCMHRGDLHDALLSVVSPNSIFPGKKLQNIENHTLQFSDGSTATADVIVGADGVHSRVRELLLGPEKPLNKGRVAYRAVFRASRVGRDL